MPRQHRSPWKLALTTAAAALCCLVPASASVATQPVGATSPPSLTSIDTASARVASLDLHRWRHGHGHRHGQSRAHQLAVRVRDSRLVGSHGAEVRLLGVNRSGTQYACVEGDGIFDGPTDDSALSRIAAWGANAVRVPLNESCWLGIDGVDPAYSGETYRTAIRDYVDRLNAAGLRVILDLHWTAPGESLAVEQQPMADRDHAPDFWRSVAQEFKHNRSVVFDVFNEPYPDSNAGSDAAWDVCPGRRHLPWSALRCGGDPGAGRRRARHRCAQRDHGRGPPVRRNAREVERVPAARPVAAAGGVDPHLLRHPGVPRVVPLLPTELLGDDHRRGCADDSRGHRRARRTGLHVRPDRGHCHDPSPGAPCSTGPTPTASATSHGGGRRRTAQANRP